MFAFIHIEKAAGTTLNHILRKNFLFRCIDVRPLSVESDCVFRPQDLEKYLMINPKLNCISGHSVQPIQDLTKAFPNIKYFTVLRNPVERYVSQFRYLVKIKRIPDDFDLFLSNTDYNNVQTKKIAGYEDFEKALNIIKNEMFEIGVVEEFDSFLLRLQKNLRPLIFDPNYVRKNITSGKNKKDWLLTKYKKEIVQRNQFDLNLYEAVIKTIIPNANKAYGKELLEHDLKKFQQVNFNTKTDFKSYLDYLIRKIYYEPVTGYLRKKSGLPAKGSY